MVSSPFLKTQGQMNDIVQIFGNFKSLAANRAAIN